MEPTSTAPVKVAVEALATATASPMTATDGDILILVADLARIACYLGELTAAARDRWADWGTVTPHLQQAEALAADITRCLSHAAGIYAFNTTGIYAFNTNRPDTTNGRLASTGTARSAA